MPANAYRRRLEEHLTERQLVWLDAKSEELPHWKTLMERGQFELYKAVFACQVNVEYVDAIKPSTNVKRLLTAPVCTLAQLKKYRSEEDMRDALLVILDLINAAFAENKWLNDQQLQMLVFGVFQKYHYLNLAEIKSVVFRGVTGGFMERGQPVRFYGSPDTETVMNWFRLYDIERSDFLIHSRTSGKDILSEAEKEFRILPEPDQPRKALTEGKVIPKEDRPKEGETGIEYATRLLSNKSKHTFNPYAKGKGSKYDRASGRWETISDFIRKTKADRVKLGILFDELENRAAREIERDPQYKDRFGDRAAYVAVMSLHHGTLQIIDQMTSHLTEITSEQANKILDEMITKAREDLEQNQRHETEA